MTERIRGVADGLAVLVAEATAARAARAGVVNGSEDAPTFYDWHNRPR